MKLLAIDTSAHVCGVCVYDSDVDRVISEESRDIGRGHAEVLMQLIENCLVRANVSYNNFSRIGVTIGPGSFTGVRVGMAVARGLGLSLDIPVVGVSTLEACEASARETGYLGELLSLLDARRGEIYCKTGNENGFVASYEAVAQKISGTAPSLCGSGALLLNEACSLSLPIVHTQDAPVIGVVARLSVAANVNTSPPEPLYLRSADAKPQTGFTLERA